MIEFGSNGGSKPTDLKVISTESIALSATAQSLLLAGKIKSDSAGVSKLANNRYRLVVTLPVANDGQPLSTNVTPPVPRIRQCPAFPHQLVEGNVTGGVVLWLSIDEKAHLDKVELVSASRPEFGTAALQAVEKWLFSKPAMKDGQPIAITMMQLITFEFEGGKSASLPWQLPPEPAMHQYVVTTSPPLPPERTTAK